MDLERGKTSDSDAESIKIPNFNDRTIWDNERNMFYQYFNQDIDRARHYITYINSNEVSFDRAVLDIKQQFKRL